MLVYQMFLYPEIPPYLLWIVIADNLCVRGCEVQLSPLPSATLLPSPAPGPVTMLAMWEPGHK